MVNERDAEINDVTGVPLFCFRNSLASISTFDSIILVSVALPFIAGSVYLLLPADAASSGYETRRVLYYYQTQPQNFDFYLPPLSFFIIMVQSNYFNLRAELRAFGPFISLPTYLTSPKDYRCIKYSRTINI